MNYNELDKLRYRQLSFQCHRQKIDDIRKASHLSPNNQSHIKSSFRSQSNRKHQLQQEILILQNNQLKNRLGEISQSTTNKQQQGIRSFRLSPAKKNMKLLEEKQLQGIVDSILRNKILKVHPHIDTKLQSKEYQVHQQRMNKLSKFERSSDRIQLKCEKYIKSKQLQKNQRQKGDSSLQVTSNQPSTQLQLEQLPSDDVNLLLKKQVDILELVDKIQHFDRSKSFF